MLVGFRTARRATPELKCAGLEGDLARRSVEPATLSLPGRVRHLADVERARGGHRSAGCTGPLGDRLAHLAHPG
jgi:hypothetical protein